MTLANCTLIARRPFAFQAGHIPSCRELCECPALPPIVVACRWSLLLLSPLLSVRNYSEVLWSRFAFALVGAVQPALSHTISEYVRQFSAGRTMQ